MIIPYRLGLSLAAFALASAPSVTTAPPAAAPASACIRFFSVDDARSALEAARRARNANAADTTIYCVLTEMTRRGAHFPDSLRDAAAALTDSILVATPNAVSPFQAKVSFLAESGREQDAAAAFERLVSIDTASGTYERYTRVIGAAEQAADTAALHRLLTAATAKFPMAEELSAQLSVLNRVPHYQALIDTCKAIIRRTPTRFEAYATLVSTYGNLGQADSALGWGSRALARGAPRGMIGDALLSVAQVGIRQAQDVDAPAIWATSLAIANRADSIVSTPATEYFVALSAAKVATEGVPAVDLLGRAPDAGAGLPPDVRAEVCPRAHELSAMVRRATDRLAAGGSSYNPSAAAAVQRQLSLIDHVLAAVAASRCGNA